MTSVPRPLRCAIYTRKSTEEGLAQSFNSLDAQREAGEAFIASQQTRGWVVVEEHYDDGGFTGAHMDRPALQRLLASVDTGQVDCVVVYKVDRLSRSLLDFARLMERFERRGISFVSVTQEFNTTTSMGRLTLNILLSFAQFEREIIGERTRDKLSAARRKGKWIGGWPVLGYDIKDGRLVVNPEEAEQVREIYRIAAEAPSLEAVVQICAARGYQTKSWTSQKGTKHPSSRLHRTTLRMLLSNVLYAGKVSHKGTVYPGEHESIVEQLLWEQVHAQLRLRSQSQRGTTHKGRQASLAGLLICAECGDPMRLTHTIRHGCKYEYYSCKHRKPNQCSQKPIRVKDLEGSLVNALAPTLGTPIQLDNLRSSVERVQCATNSRRVLIQFRDGTRTEYEVTIPTRRGVRGEDTPDIGRIPRVSRLMALAIKFERLVREGRVPTYRLLAQAGHISRARLSQILHLTELAPDIQEDILFLPLTVSGHDVITEKALREISGSVDWHWQRRRFHDLKERISGAPSS